jgi:ABC-2 type transport system permease protein
MRRNLTLVASQVRYEQLAYWRTPRRALFTFGFPVMFLLLFGSLQQGTRIDSLGIDWTTFYVPGILAYMLITQAFSNMLVSMASARDSGLIKRVRGAPVPWWAWVAGRIGSTVAITTLACVITLAIGALAFGVEVPAATLPGLLAAIVAGTVCFTALGIGATRFVSSADSAGPLQALLVTPIALVSGIFFPLTGPQWLQSLAGALPIEPLAHALHHVFDPAASAPGLAGSDLAVLGLWTLLGAWLTVLFLEGVEKRA